MCTISNLLECNYSVGKIHTIFNISVANARLRNLKGKSRMGNPETLATLHWTQDEDKTEYNTTQHST
jgi:hypothetical protein